MNRLLTAETCTHPHLMLSQVGRKLAGPQPRDALRHVHEGGALGEVFDLLVHRLEGEAPAAHRVRVTRRGSRQAGGGGLEQGGAAWQDSAASDQTRQAGGAVQSRAAHAACVAGQRAPVEPRRSEVEDVHGSVLAEVVLGLCQTGINLQHTVRVIRRGDRQAGHAGDQARRQAGGRGGAEQGGAAWQGSAASDQARRQAGGRAVQSRAAQRGTGQRGKQDTW